MSLPFKIAQPIYCPPDCDTFDTLCACKHVLAQEKKDGQRCIVWRTVDDLVLLSRKGNVIKRELPNVRAAMMLLPQVTLLDTELFQYEDIIFPFDAVFVGRKNISTLPTGRRIMLMNEALPDSDCVHTIPQATEDKRAFYNGILAEGGEGIVLKQLNKPYPEGRTVDWIKVKPHE